MLCFEVWRNEEKLVTAGLRETGVLSFILSWVGQEPNASAIASASTPIPGLHCRVGGLDTALDPAGDTHVEWYETEELKLGDEIRIRLISSVTVNPPVRRSASAQRGKPDWAKKT
jgi:hypothetical protein